MALTGRLRGFPRAGTLDPHLCDTLAVFVMVTALVAGAGGLLVSESPGPAGAVVQGLAWVKGESLDVQLYGIPRAVSWAARVKLWPSASPYCVGTPEYTFAAQWPACTSPCQRFPTPLRGVEA